MTHHPSPRPKLIRIWLGAISIGFICQMVPLSGHTKDQWELSVTPYLLAPSIKGDTGAGRFINNAAVDVDSGDIFDHLDLGSMIHLEAQHQSGWGMVLDYAFMDLSSKTQSPLNSSHQIKADVFQGTLETFASYRTAVTSQDNMDSYAGIRWWDIDADLELRNGTSNPSVSAGDDWIDPVVGLRWVRQWTPTWSTALDGNIGGFGIASDFTSAITFVASYAISDGISLVAGYKALWVDYDNDEDGTDHFAYDTVTHGPLIGASFKF